MHINDHISLFPPLPRHSSSYIVSSCNQPHHADDKNYHYYADDKINCCQEVSPVNWMDFLISLSA